jgi:hypothetical protein
MLPDLMAYIDIMIQDRAAGQPASAESIERDRKFLIKAAEIARLRDLRRTSATRNNEASPKKVRRKTAKQAIKHGGGDGPKGADSAARRL